jgi:hypothetical protein
MPEGRGRSLPFRGRQGWSTLPGRAVVVSVWTRGAILVVVPGQKQKLSSAKGYLVIVNQYSQDGSISAGKVQSVTVCDPDNKFLAFDNAFTDVQHVLYEWGSIFVLCGDGKVWRALPLLPIWVVSLLARLTVFFSFLLKMYQLSERDFESKMEILFKKNRYDIAISLAKRQQRSQEDTSDTLVEIYIQYGSEFWDRCCCLSAPTYLRGTFVDSGVALLQTTCTRKRALTMPSGSTSGPLESWSRPT